MQTLQRSINTFVIAALAVCGSHTAFADTTPEPTQPQSKTMRLEAGPQSTLRFEGTSTLHAFKVRASAFTTVLSANVAAGSTRDDAALLQAITSNKTMVVDVRIPVAALESGEKDLDKNMAAALQGDKFPEIIFHLDTYSTVPIADRPNAFATTNKGVLTIAGISRAVAFTTEVVQEKAQLRITGTTTVNMKDYGITPPTFLFGTISTGPELVIHFSLAMVAPSTESASK